MIKKHEYTPLVRLATEIGVQPAARKVWYAHPLLKDLTIRFLQYVGDGKVNDRYLVRETVRLALTAYFAAERRGGDAMGWFLYTWIEEGCDMYQHTCTSAAGETWNPAHQSLSDFADGKDDLIWVPNELGQTMAIERFANQFFTPVMAETLLRKYRDREVPPSRPPLPSP
ncbi:hypothetical protein [Cupriavidus sp. CuC1]|uniref:hypothetical protein n=1 Tax=Cupriavidus sp. CuC1 TaxID=3373131 RepID=UPI0037D5A942